MSDAVRMLRLDILSMKVYFKSYLIVMIYPLIFSWWAPSMLAVVCCFMFAVVASSVFSVQEKANLDRLYGIFHLSKGSIIGGRYLFVLLNMVAAFALTAPAYLIITSVSGSRPESNELIFGYGLGLLFFWLLIGIQTPIFFRLGYTRARFWSYFPFLLVAAVPLLAHFFPGLGETALARGLVRLLEGAQHSPWAFLIACACASAVIAGGSVLLSMWFYRGRRG